MEEDTPQQEPMQLVAALAPTYGRLDISSLEIMMQAGLDPFPPAAHCCQRASSLLKPYVRIGNMLNLHMYNV